MPERPPRSSPPAAPLAEHAAAAAGLMKDACFQTLLVEDNRHDARLIELMLTASESARFEVEWVVRLTEARRKLAEQAFDVILADLSLPDSHGLETFQALCRQSPDTPIVVLSGLDDQETAVRAVEAGAQDYLVKGRDSDESTVRAIHFAIRRFRAGLEMQQRAEHLRLLTRQLPCVFWTTDKHLNFTSFSGADRAGLIAPPDDAGRQNLVDYFESQAVDPLVIEASRRAARDEPATFDLQWNDRIYHVHIEPFRQRDGHLMGTIGLAQDVTDQKLIDLELRVTRGVQEGLLPSAPLELEDFQIAGSSLPAAEAGGDYFDYFTMPGGAIGVVVCDVAGHGLGPAMMMCQTRAYLRALALSYDVPEEILSLVNGFLCKDTREDRLVALFFAKLTPGSRAFSYANAGHRGFLLHAGGRVAPLSPTAIPLNVLADMPIDASDVRHLDAGDIVLLYTDGVIETMDAERNQFGIDRMLECVQNHRDRSARDIVDQLFHDVKAFGREGLQEDDMTAVVIKCR